MTTLVAPASTPRVPALPAAAGDAGAPARRPVSIGWVAVLFTVVGIAVVAPWTGRGWLVMLDWTAGPRATLTNSAYGLDPAQLDAMPVRVALAVLRMVVGPGPASWLPVLVFFPAAAAGMARLVDGPTTRRLAAAALFVANPFVVQRLQAGQLLVLGGYALLPWATRSFLAARASGRWFRVRSAGWLALMVSVSPHMLWIGGVVLAASLVSPRPRLRDLVRVVLTVFAALAVYAYGVVMYLSGVHLAHVGHADLAAFPTAGGTTLGQLANVVTLQGFWRQSAAGAVWSPGGFTVAVVGVAFAVIVLGVRAGLRNRGTRALTVTVAVAGAAGVVLALGASGPTGFVYRLAFDHLPFFQVMREAQKFTMLVALAAAVGFGLGAEWVVARTATPGGGQVRRAATVGALALVPVLTLPSLAWGLGGDVRLSHFPASWSAAERIMGPGPESVLFLPWHQYQAFPFTDGRTVRNPAAAFFSRPVVDGDALELPGLRTSSTSARSAYLEQLLARGAGIRSLGQLLAPLGVRYVALATTTVDESYRWLGHQRDLVLVLDRPDLRVWRVVPSATGRVVGARAVHGVDDLIALANAGTLGSEAVLPAATTDVGVAPGAAAGGLTATSPVRYSLSAGAPGWVVAPAPSASGWRLDGRRGVPTLAGGLAFRAGAHAGTIAYRPWRWVKWGEMASGVALVALVAIGLLEHRRQLTRRRSS